MRAKEFTTEAAFGTNPKRPARPGSRPDRGHKTEPRYKPKGVAEGFDDDDEIDRIKIANNLQWPEVVNKVSSAMKAMGWKSGRKDDGAFIFSTKGQETDDQWYMVIIDNVGHRHFAYALGTVEEGDPHIGEQGHLPNTEASVSELMNAIRDGFGLNEGWFDSKPKVDFKVRAKELFAKGLTEQQVLQQLIKEGCPPNQAAVFVQGAQIQEHKKNRIAKKYTKKPVAPVSPSEVHAKAKAKINPAPAAPKPVEQKVNEKASRALCTSSTPDEDLGASNLASCKSQGLRARDGNKSHKLGSEAKSRVKVGGHKIKGHKYGGPLPDWS
jgi:hypothetical protein